MVVVAVLRMVRMKREELWRRGLFLLVRASEAVVAFGSGVAPAVGQTVMGRREMMWVAVAEGVEMRRAEEVER